ncbi:MAG: hypothetical protein Q9166_006920 [cf. Caloplaca sp. 2 TL-2023]
MDHQLSPSESSNLGYESEDKRPQSGWSDSDHSDSQTKSWVTRGSKMLKKQNSKFNLSSSKTAEWVEEHDDASEYQAYPRGLNKHGRMWSTGNGKLHPVLGRHLTHTQARQFSEIHNASQDKLATEFFAIRAAQPPKRELQGIQAEDLKSRLMEATPPTYSNSVTPPLSPVKPRGSRAGSVLSIKDPGTISRSRSIDNFSQPSPKAYRIPRSPTSPPPRTSSRNAMHAAPDFFSDDHHATAEERELLSICEAPLDPSAQMKSPSETLIHGQMNQTFDDGRLPHAITTPDDVAFMLQPPLLRRSTPALADVPEEDELHSIKRVSMESSRPMTADSGLRHAKSFPSNRRTGHRRAASSSRKSVGRPDSVSIDGPLNVETMDPFDVEQLGEVPVLCRRSQRMSMGTKAIDTCWEDDIDYCYQHQAEADCDFDWDCMSIKQGPTVGETQNREMDTHSSRESAGSLSKSFEVLNSQSQGQDASSHHLPRLQTSLPDLEFSAASSAKSSMASLRGPVTPMQQLPSPGKVKFATHPSKSTDTLNLDSSLFNAQDPDVLWSHEDSFQKEPGWEHASTSYYPLNVLPLAPRKNSSTRSSQPRLSTHPSSESVLLSQSNSATRHRRNTASGGSLPEMACSKNYRQYAEVTTKQIEDRLVALSVTKPQEQINPVASKPAASLVPEASVILLPSIPQAEFGSVAAFASRLRSNSVASSSSGSSSTQASRVSYSLFPAVPSARS